MFVDSSLYVGSIHGEFECIDCHSDAEEIPHEEQLAKVDCGMCHDDAVEAYQSSVHGTAKEIDSLHAASCVDCHGKHDILPTAEPDSRVHPLNLASTCARCHADPNFTKTYDIPVSDPLAAYRNSVHGIALMSEKNLNAATCVSCHGLHGIRSLSDPASPIHWRNVSETCGQCHAEQLAEYSASVHWKAALRGVRQSPICTDCHGEHDVKSTKDPKSPVHPLRVSAETCERCHASELITERYGMAVSRVETFEDSYHGLAIKGGSLAAANCASCHGIHRILPSSDPSSLIHPANLQATCGSCHKDATANFAKGPVHVTRSTTPGRVVRAVRLFYIWLIAIVIGGMVIHNGTDFLQRARRVVRAREEK
ncbi:hypothetical protein MJD09_14540 [bacterium]|nr:hypothetical protein [bacterium]